MDGQAQPINNPPPVQAVIAGQPAPQQKNGNPKTFIVVVLVLLFIVSLVGIVAETIYLSKNDYQRCTLLSCQPFGPSTPTPTVVPNKLSVEKVYAMIKFLGPEGIASSSALRNNLFDEFKFFMKVEGFVWYVAPDGNEFGGAKTVLTVLIIDKEVKGPPLRILFTEAELKKTTVKIITLNPEKVYDGTAYDIKQGDYVVITFVYDLVDNGSQATILNGSLDTSGKDSINIDIRR